MMPPPDQWDLFPDEEPSFEDNRPRFKATSTRVWSKFKAGLIERYMFLFLMVTRHGIYIDGFSGPQYRDALDKWSAKRVVEIQPRWLTKFYLCELSPTSAELLRSMVAEQPPRIPKKEPKRVIEVIEGDFNEKVSEILAKGTISAKQAAFCLLDQRTFECHWSTVEALARHKSTNKIELLYFLPIKWFQRALAAQKNTDVLDRWWGDDTWRDLRGISNDGVREAFQRKFKQLGYRHVCCWPIYSSSRATNIMYYMIQATDHDEAPKIMFRAYKQAVTPNPPPVQIPLIVFED